MPLQVYLDSSDFSDLSDPSKRTPQRVDVERHLLDLKERQKIELRFSYAHVIEAAPADPDSTSNARRRLRCIKALCGGSCLVDPFSLLEQEARQAAGEVPDKASLRRSDGVWIPDVVRDALNEMRPLPDAIREEIQARPRAERRKGMNKTFDQRGNLRPAILQSMHGKLAASVFEATSRMPLNNEAADALMRYLIGLGTLDVAEAAFIESIADLETFGDWYVSHWNAVTAASSWLRSTGHAFLTMCLDLSNKIAALASEAESIDKADSFKQSLRADLKQQVEVLKERIVRRLLEAQGAPLPNVPIRIEWDTAPGLSMMIALIGELQWLSVGNSRQTRSPKASDFGDALHALYLPYVDVFRADGAAANAIRVAKPSCPTVVASKFNDLPHLIAQELAKRS